MVSKEKDTNEVKYMKFNHVKEVKQVGKCMNSALEMNYHQ
jgi:hypothetical protein